MGNANLSLLHAAPLLTCERATRPSRPSPLPLPLPPVPIPKSTRVSVGIIDEASQILQPVALGPGDCSAHCPSLLWRSRPLPGPTAARPHVRSHRGPPTAAPGVDAGRGAPVDGGQLGSRDWVQYTFWGRFCWVGGGSFYFNLWVDGGSFEGGNQRQRCIIVRSWHQGFFF